MDSRPANLGLCTSAAGSIFEQWVERHLRILMLAPAMLVLLALTIFPSAYMFVAAVTRISPNPDAALGVRRSSETSSKLLTGFAVSHRLVEHSRVHIRGSQHRIPAGPRPGIAARQIYVRRLNLLKTLLMLPMMLPPVAVGHHLEADL
jgi:multiple sugar transport system permease protein